MFDQLADGSENMGIMVLVLFTEFPVRAERLPEGSRIAGHQTTLWGIMLTSARDSNSAIEKSPLNLP